MANCRKRAEARGLYWVVWFCAVLRDAAPLKDLDSENFSEKDFYAASEESTKLDWFLILLFQMFKKTSKWDSLQYNNQYEYCIDSIEFCYV